MKVANEFEGRSNQTANKLREDRKVTVANKDNGYSEVTVKMYSNFKGHSSLMANNKAQVAANLECEAPLTVRRWHVCAKTLNLEIVCATA